MTVYKNIVIITILFAYRMDPNNQRALEGLNNIGRPDSSYYVSGEPSTYPSQPTAGSDHEADADSDTDHWPNSHDMMSFMI